MPVDHQTISRAIGLLQGAGFRLPDGTKMKMVAETWAVVFRDISPVEFKTAVEAFIRSDKRGFWPVPGVLYSLVPRIAGERQLQAVDDADVAWGEVLALIVEHGSYSEPPTYDEDATRDAAKKMGVGACGGWRALCRTDEAQIGMHRASFRGAYRAHRDCAKARGDWDPSRALEQETQSALPGDQEKARGAALAVVEGMKA